MLGLSAGNPLNSYDDIRNPPSKHPAARWVRTLPMLQGGCSMRAFVELYTMCNFRTDNFYEKRQEKNKERNLKKNSSSSTKEDIDDAENDEEKLKMTASNGRRDGQLVMKGLPFAVIVIVAKYLRHAPVLRFALSQYRCGFHTPKFFDLTVVEDMEFDLYRVVSFSLKIAVNGTVLLHSRFFLNPDMTWGVDLDPEILLLDKKKKDDDEGTKLLKKALFEKGLTNGDSEERLLHQVLFFETKGVMLFDPPFRKMKGLFTDGKERGRFGGGYKLEGSLM